jgi:hypothetical protein
VNTTAGSKLKHFKTLEMTSELAVLQQLKNAEQYFILFSWQVLNF